MPYKLDDLDEDLLCLVLEFLQDVPSLRSFAYTKKAWAPLVFQDSRVEKCFPQGGRNITKTSLLLKGLFKRIGKRFRLPRVSTDTQESDPFRTVGILNEDEEIASYAYYEPDAGIRLSPGVQDCAGYFGFELLPQEVAVWGDFSGLSVFPSKESFLRGKNSKRSAKEADVGERENGSGILFGSDNQVMAVHYQPKTDEASSLLFLGMATGKIHCMSVDGKEDSEQVESPVKDPHNRFIKNYPYVSCYSKHLEEVSVLSNCSRDHLISFSFGSEAVVVHWNALLDGDLNRTTSLPLQHELPIVSVTAMQLSPTTLFLSHLEEHRRHGNNCFRAYCYEKQNDERTNAGATNINGTVDKWTRVPNFMKIEKYTGQYFQKLFGNRMLRCSAGLGPARANMYLLEEEYIRNRRYITLKVDFHLRSFFRTSSRTSSSSIEFAEVEGDTLLVSDNDYGRLRLWSMLSGDFLGVVIIHPTRPIDCVDGIRRKTSPVISFRVCHERSCIICLCRDGYVYEWPFGQEFEIATKIKKRRHEPAMKVQSKRRVPPRLTMA